MSNIYQGGIKPSVVNLKIDPNREKSFIYVKKKVAKKGESLKNESKNSSLINNNLLSQIQ